MECYSAVPVCLEGVPGAWAASCSYSPSTSPPPRAQVASESAQRSEAQVDAHENNPLSLSHITVWSPELTPTIAITVVITTSPSPPPPCKATITHIRMCQQRRNWVGGRASDRSCLGGRLCTSLLDTFGRRGFRRLTRTHAPMSLSNIVRSRRQEKGEEERQVG